MLLRVQLRLAFALVILLALAGCTTPSAVSQFTASATTTMTAATQVLGDMKPSCLREVDNDSGLGTFALPAQNNASCDEIGAQAVSAQAVAQLLADYFSAINALASFGTAKAGADAGALVKQASAAATGDAAAASALESIGAFLTSAATAGYQQRQIEKDLTHVSANITSVLNALSRIVSKNYVDQTLGAEEQKLRTRYRLFAAGKSPEMLLALEDRWRAEERDLQTRRASARSLVTAMQTLSRGFADLAANSRKLNGREIPALLAPYAAQIQTLIPQIQKAF